MKAKSKLIKQRKPHVRRVFGRVKDVVVDWSTNGNQHKQKAAALATFELRKDGLHFHRKHSPKWHAVAFSGLVAESRRQQAMAKALADAQYEDPRQLVMFRAELSS